MPKRESGALERAVLLALSAASEPMSVAQVQSQLPGRPAYTTVMPTLSRLTRKGVLTQVRDGRAFRVFARRGPGMGGIGRDGAPDAPAAVRWRGPRRGAGQLRGRTGHRGGTAADRSAAALRVREAIVVPRPPGADTPVCGELNDGARFGRRDRAAGLPAAGPVSRTNPSRRAGRRRSWWSWRCRRCCWRWARGSPSGPSPWPASVGCRTFTGRRARPAVPAARPRRSRSVK